MDQENLTIHLEKANTLDKLLSEEQRKKVVNLKITGHIGKQDFDNVLDELCDVDLIYKNPDDELEEGIPDYRNAYPLRNLDMGAAVFTDGDILPDFGYHTQLESIILPQGIKSIVEENDFDSALSNSQRLHTVVFPESIKSLGGLDGCTKLKNVVFPDTVEVIYSDAFFYCESLKSFCIPASVKEIQYSAFAHSGIEAFEIDEQNPYYTVVNGVLFTKDLTELVAFPPKSDKKEYTIPSTTKIIGAGAFLGSELRYINIPDSVTRIEGCAFEDSKLRSLEMPDSVTEIGHLLFRCCNNLEHLKLSNSLTDIPEQTISNCEKLKTITIPSSVKKMHITNIIWSGGLESMVLNEGLEEIYNVSMHYSTNFSKKRFRIINWPKSLRAYPKELLQYRK